jgi:hypothetical protein
VTQPHAFVSLIRPEGMGSNVSAEVLETDDLDGELLWARAVARHALAEVKAVSTRSA